MKLKAIDQIHISSVSADTIAPGTEFAVSAALGKELLAKRPDAVELVEDEPEPEEEKMDKAPENKAEPSAPANKSQPKPASKPAPTAKTKGE